MDDLSLSQSLGGLRIANPDKDDDDVKPNTTTTTAHPSSAAEHNPSSASSIAATSAYSNSYPHSYSQPLESDALNVGSLGFDPSTYNPGTYQPSHPSTTEPASSQHKLAHRQSMPLGEYQQQEAARPYHAPSQQRPYYSQSNRPASGLYQHPNMSSASGSTTESSYSRMRAETSQSAASANLQRSHSRAAAAAAMQATNPSRTPSGRQYNPAVAAAPPAPTMYPPRRSSRGPSNAPAAAGYLSRQASAPTSHQNLPPSYASDSVPLPSSSEEWQERGAATTLQKTVDHDGKTVSKVVKKGVKDFAFGRTLGEGSYSQVLFATDRTTNRDYAIKILDKRHIIKEKKVKYVNIEKDTLNRLTDHPGIVRLYYTFQDERSLYFVIDVAPNGELLGVLKKYASFDEDCSRFYGAEILDAIEYMHSRGIIHRDLKPENVLLDGDMHVKITDFGTAKILDISKQPQQFGNISVANDPMDGADQDRAVSFVGTAEYVSPELLTEKNACKASDLWAFGCIIYQLLAGRPPFKAANEYLTFQKIVNLEYSFPEGFPSVARDLVKKLLVLDPADRLPIDAIKAHPFFEGIQWGKGLWKQKPPKLRPFKPYQRDATLAASRAQESMMAPAVSRPSVQQSVSSSHQQSSSRPKPRVITELAPPTQLDIDWSPVLTRPNERVLKLGQLTVYSTPAPYSPTSRSHGDTVETPSKFSRLFGASTTKKRTRLVMISSAARIIIAASGGDKKEAKTVIDLTDKDVSWRSQVDSKGYTVWCVYTRDRHFTFEDTKANTGDSGSSVRSTEDWLGYVESVREHVETSSMASAYSSEDVRYNGMGAMGSQSSIDPETGEPLSPPSRGMLRKDPNDNDTIGRKRFSKRHSKNGLTAVF